MDAASPPIEGPATVSPAARSAHVRLATSHVSAAGGIVRGIAYPALDPLPDGAAIPAAEALLRIDTWDTWMTRADLVALAHAYLEYSRLADSDHNRSPIGAIV